MEKIIKETEPKRHILKNSLRAFLVGGMICSIAQFFIELLNKTGLEKNEVNALAVTIMVFLGALLTGLGVYDKIGQFGGCGSIVPITGFANSMTSSALEYKSEGLFLGILTNMFKLAGSVIVTGVISSYLIGTIRYLLGLL